MIFLGETEGFLPANITAAVAYFYMHPDAEGLRSSKINYLVGQVNVGTFDDSPDEEGNIPTIPATFYETEDVYDLSEQYPEEFDDMGMRGVYVSTPFDSQRK